MNIKRIIKEEIDDFEWIKNTSHVSAEEGNNFILIADVIEDLPCKPQEMMFKAGYRWAGDIPSVHGNPLECKDKGIHNKPYVLIPQQGAVNYYNGYRKFGMVGWMNREGGTKFMRDYIKKWNPTIILWSDVVNKEPDFVLDMDNSINEQDDFDWIRNTTPIIMDNPSEWYKIWVLEKTSEDILQLIEELKALGVVVGRRNQYLIDEYLEKEDPHFSIAYLSISPLPSTISKDFKDTDNRTLLVSETWSDKQHIVEFTREQFDRLPYINLEV